MNWNDLYRVKIFFKDGITLNTIFTLAEFEEWYGKNTSEFYYLELELVKENEPCYTKEKEKRSSV